jgi:hypothetical protein
VFGAAGWGEGAWHGEEHGFAWPQQHGGIGFPRAFRGCNHEFHGRDFIAYFDHDDCLCFLDDGCSYRKCRGP